MEKATIFLVLLISFSLFSAIYFLNFFNMTGMFIGYGMPQNAEWWNISWHYRTRLEIQSTQYTRVDWPVEQHMNFTDILPSETFDINSTRVFEYSNGHIIREVPSQFEPDDDFNASNNAIGTLVFMLNGTTNANNNRTFFVYYDSIQKGNKSATSYPVSVSYSWDGKLAQVNNSFLILGIDTGRLDNTSGFYRIENYIEDVLINAGDFDRTAEYVEYSNGTNNFTFDLLGNASFINGNVRLVIEQRGDEIVAGVGKTNELSLTKKYYIYEKVGVQNKGTFIKIYQKVKNNAGYSVNRNSTQAGALAWDVANSFLTKNIFGQDYNSTNPFSWSWAEGGISGANEVLGLVNLVQNGTSNFYASNSPALGRIGIQLGETTINSGSSIEQTSLIFFAPTGGATAVSEFEDTRDRFTNPIAITQYLPEVWYVDNIPTTNETVYNKNETMLISGDATIGDPYNLTEYMNVTLDMGTVSSADDQTIILYDDGLHQDGSSDDGIFSNYYQIPNSGTVGIWTANFTVYANTSEFLNYTTYQFNVTDVLNISVNVVNKIGLVGRTVLANVFVKNYRNVSWITGATINCSYNSIDVTNMSDNFDGTYSINFTAPNQEGDYYVSCNATSNNNTGQNNDSFVTEVAKLNVTVTPQPSSATLSNITLMDSQSFSTLVNASNLANGTAYNSNMSLELLAGWSSNVSIYQCGNVAKKSFCNRSFEITAPNGTAPGYFYINASFNWTNPDGTLGYNSSIINVTVTSNPRINVTESFLSEEVGDGINSRAYNFTILSIGNDALQNVNFTCYSGAVCTDFMLNFTPTSLSSLASGSNYSVAINVTVPLGYSVGNYSGILNISSSNDGYKNLTLNISLARKTNMSVSTLPSGYNSSSITRNDNENFVFNATIANIKNASAKYANITLSMNSNLSSNSTLEQCNNLTKGMSCTKAFGITIFNKTSPGTYYITVSAVWLNPDGTIGTNSTLMNVTVRSNPVINVTESYISGTVADASRGMIGNFTILSIGNDALQNVNFTCYSGAVCTDFMLNFTPTSLSSLASGSNYSVAINVTVPLGYSVGNYSGILNISSSNDGYRNLTVNVSVPSNRTWSQSATSCDRSENPDEGTVCDITISNIGNDVMNFSVSPQAGNYTAVNVTNFSVSKWTNYVFRITYNVSGVPQALYNSLFNVDALDSNANPSSSTINVTLYPYLPPMLDFAMYPEATQQNSSVLILANVTDRGSSGIAMVRINVTKPDGTSNETNMTLVETLGNVSRWSFTYPSSLGNTNLRGFYNVTITALDNIGNTGNLTRNFSIYSKVFLTTSTLSSNYLQGDTGSIYFVARNGTGHGLRNVSTTFEIRNSNNNVSYASESQTNSEGTIVPMPSFTLATDAPTGAYTLFANSTYFDEMVNKTVTLQSNSTFQVSARTITVTGLFADIETSVSWYPNNIMKYGILVYNGEGRPVDPTMMNLSIYDPANNLYFVANLSQMSKQSTGYYTYSYAMGAGTPVGMYLAVVNVTQDTFNTMKLRAFRVSQGGPYDIRINLFENEVPRGSYLDFELVAENKGEVTQDVFVEYTVESNNVTYYTSSEAVLTPANSVQRFTRSVFIYSTQPLGNYILRAKVTYSSVVPSITANQSFVVISSEGFEFPPVPQNPPPVYTYGPSGGFVTTYPPAPTEKIKSSILISDYNTNITLARSLRKMESVTVKNNGIYNLTNVSLFLIGVPTSWFNVTPDVISDALMPDKSAVFLVEFNLPKNAKDGVYNSNFIASSGVVTDQKSTSITVYQTILELLKEELRNVKMDLETLKVDVKIAEREGKDVSNVLIIVNESENQIRAAEVDMDAGELESASDRLQNAIVLLKKARNLLDSLQSEQVEAPFPIFNLLIALIVIVVIIIALAYLWKKKKLERIRPYIIPLGKLVENVKRKEAPAASNTDKLLAEREKISRMLMVLEREKSSGMISQGSYDKMKSSLEEKLKEVERKIK
jgi:hypothetical protein